MIVKLLTEHHLEFLSLKGGYRGSSESTHVKMPHCWKSHALAQFFELVNLCRDRYLRAISGNFHAHNSSVEKQEKFLPCMRMTDTRIVCPRCTVISSG